MSAKERQPDRNADELIKQLGRVTYEWSQLEVVTVVLVRGLARVPREVARILTSGDHLRDLWVQCEALLELQWDAGALAWFKTWLSKTQPLVDGRNRAVNATWTLDLRSMSLVGADWTGKANRMDANPPKRVPGGVAELSRLADSVAARRTELMEWMVSLFADGDAPNS